MNRDELLKNLETTPAWDVIIIGGGATGLGAAVEAASRGHRTLLLEQDDFAKGTSSRSTKLSHGGVRYLEQGNIKLVFSALHERGLMIRNAPHLVHPLAFVIPAYKIWHKFFYGFGLWFYEMLSGRLSLGHSRVLNRAETLKRLPTLQADGLRGGILYMDGQFDDARMAVTLAQTFADLGGTPLNFMRVRGLLKKDGIVSGVSVEDIETGKRHEIQGKAVLNATGVFTDTIRKQDDADSKQMLSVSQGTHIMLEKSFLPSSDALMIPKTEDGRVLFALPWHGHVLVGTTDLAVKEASLEPRALDEEIEFLLHHASKYLSREVKRSDVLSIFSGLRPLVKAAEGQSTAQLSRDHTIVVSKSKLVTITGGKWTSYRHMGEDAVNHLEKDCGLTPLVSKTEDLHLHGWMKDSGNPTTAVYGSDAAKLEALVATDSSLGKLLHPALPYRHAEVVWAVRQEMARNVEDVLSRRTRALLLNAAASIEAAPVVADIMAKELGRSVNWVTMQISSYTQLANSYLLTTKNQISDNKPYMERKNGKEKQ